MELTLENSEIVITLLASSFLIWFLYRWSSFNFRSFPPGPIGLPFFGYLELLWNNPDEVLFKLSKKYGKIFSVYIGPVYTVVITDYDLAKEVLSHPASLSRPRDVFGFIPGDAGFAGVNGAEWAEQRRFCVASLKNLGFGRGKWENIIQTSVNEFVEETASSKGKPRHFTEMLTILFSTVYLSLLIGRSISKKSDYETKLIKDAHVLLSHHFAPSCLTALMPWLSDYLIKFRIGSYHKNKERLKEFENMIRKEIDERQKSDNLENSDDFLGIYLSEMKKQQASGKLNYFTVNRLVGNIILLFFAGSDTSKSSLHWVLKLMAMYPEVQKKVHRELDDVIGKDRQVGWNDRKQLPYTMAVILELERYVSIVRLFIPRITSVDFQCNGYTIPKGSRTAVHSWAIMHDTKYWDNPMEFIPERFIRNDGKDPSKLDGISTFSFGRRKCPAELVALMTLFIYFTTIMQKFQIKTPSGLPPNLNIEYYSVVVNPPEETLCFIER